MGHEELISLPQHIQGAINRPLEAIDIEIIFRDAGPWWLYFALLLYTGVRCDKLALLTYRNVDRDRSVIIIPEGRSGRFRNIPMVPDLLEQIPADMPPDAPLFPTLYSDVEDRSIFEEELNNNLAEPLNYMQALLSAAGRPIASLHSFTLSHRNLLQGHDLTSPDQQVILFYLARAILRTRSTIILN